jgi:hypothetical protein
MKNKLRITDTLALMGVMGCKAGLQAAKDLADIEHMLACHGGDTDDLWDKARKLARTTPMSIKDAVTEVIYVDQATRQEPKGFLSWE